MTADALQGTREALLGCGFDGYLSKPIVIGDLIRTLDLVAPGSDILVDELAD